MTVTGPMANFLDRLRVLAHGNKHGGKLRNKVGAGFAVVWFRNGGIRRPCFPCSRPS